jgi:hypothetical protein
MHFQHRTFTAALFALLALPLAASAQTATPARLASGTWTGMITTPGNQEPTSITFEVGYKADTLAIALVVGEHGTFPLSDIELSEKTLKFSFTPGPKVSCVLNSSNTGYEGNCSDDDGNVVPLTMITPAGEPAR